MTKPDGLAVKVWITKYALGSRGIFAVPATEIESGCIEVARGDGPYGTMRFYAPRDWHRTRQAAVVHAREMRQAEIENLTKRIEELHNIDFEHVHD